MIKVNDMEVEINRFPDGTLAINPQCYQGVFQNFSNTVISWFYDGDDELFTLMCLCDILRRSGKNDIILNLPYIPNARMDRIHSAKENFSLKVFANFINQLGFKEVDCFVAHSSVSNALINNLCDRIPIAQIANAIKEFKPTMLFFPDEGACKRYSDLSMIQNYSISFGIKNRDWASGKIKGLTIHGDSPKGHRVLIVDDICSLGGTFFHSANALKEQGASDVGLYITHCENTIEKGELLKETSPISNIYTTDTICSVVHPKITYVFKYRG